jgi:hypothetical protein
MTQRGYHDSVRDIMSFVPSATTIAVVLSKILSGNMSAPTDALRPTRVFMETDVHLFVLRTFSASDPNALAPNVRLSPIIKRFPWPFVLIDRGLAVAPDIGAMTASASTNRAVPIVGIGPDLRGRRDNWGTPLLWQRVDVLSEQMRY